MRRTKRTIWTGLLSLGTALALTATSACGGGAPPAPPGNVDIVNNSFQPKSIKMTVGGTFYWKNLDQVTHTVTFTKPEGFDEPLSPGSMIGFTPGITGKIEYKCKIHGFKGEIHSEENPG